MMTGLNNITGRVFPAWEQSVSSVGTGRSQRGNNMFSARDAKELQSCRHTLSILFEYAWSMARACLEYGKSMPRVWVEYGVMVVLLLFVGVGEVWGDEDPYEGFWYINNQKGEGYYFVPTINCFYNGDEDKPHLTTFQTGKDKNSIWRIEPVPVEPETYYRIIHNATGKYLMANTAITDLANASAAHRKRVHLETLSAQDFENLNSNPETDNSLFVLTVINAENKIVAIKSKNVGSSETGEGDTHWYLNPRGEPEHFNSYRAKEGREITSVNGTVGFYGKDDDNTTKPQNQPGSQWKLETATSTCANPVIQYTDASTIQISYPISDDTDWTIYYTTDGSDPSSSGTGITEATSISAAGVTKVRAIAKKEGWGDSEEAVLIASGVTQMIQSKECDAFYMVPPIVDGDLAYATTTNIPHAKMGWNFVPAGLYCGIQYYNIINAETGEYLYCNGEKGADNALSMKVEEDISSLEQIDRAKFRLIVQADGSYKVISKWWAAENVTDAYYVNKKNGNNGGNALNLADGTSNIGQWNIIAAPSSPKTQFDASFASTYSSVHFYEIQSATGATENTTYHVIPPTTSDGNATVNTTGANPAWFFMPIDDNDTWIPYYHIRNAATGEYLYFNSGSFYTSLNVEPGNEDRYLFIVVKSAYTTTTNPVHYNIIPKALKDNAKQENNSLNRNGTTLRILDSRNKAESNWKLEEVALFCNDPVFTEETDGTISISCVPDITRIYYTTDGTEPDPTDETQRYTSTTKLSARKILCIKAISYVSDGTNNVSSPVYTLLNKPNVTLSEGENAVTDNTYTYDGTAKVPTVEVSITTGNNTVIAPTGPTATYTVAYSDNTNAGTASVTVTDAKANDNWYLWNIPTKTFTIDKASLTATVDDVTVSYGDPIPTYTASYTGFVNGETDPGFAPEPTFSCDYTPTSSAGSSYEITISGGEAPNYKIATSTPGTLTVGQKSIGDGTNIASSLTLSFGPGGAIVLTDGETTLTENTDYVISGSTSASGKYSERTVSGSGSYTGSFTFTNANVSFQTDANELEWSATFVAEPIGGGDADDTKGHAIPDGMRAFIITGIEDDWAIPEQLTYIPEGIPVLLVSDKATGGFIVKDASDKTRPTSTNWLVEVKTDWENIPSRSVYLLYNNEFVLNNGGTGYTLSAGKVYLSKTAPGGGGGGGGAPARLKIKWNTVSGITELRNNESTEQQTGIGWYSIDGRRLNGKPSAKGLYIVDGKKIMIK